MRLDWLRRSYPCLIACAVLLAACERDPTVPPPASSRIDTIGGVVQVTNPAMAPEVWRIEPGVTIGAMGLGGEPRTGVFGRVASVIGDDEGNVYVADGQAREIRVFDPTGVHLRTMGREGEGPGEFGTLYSLMWIADTLHVLDAGNARIRRMTRDGRDVGSLRWLPLTGPSVEVRIFPAADGLLHVRGLAPRAPDGRSFLRGLRFLTYRGDAPSDSVFVSLAERPEGVVECQSPQMISGWSSPLNSRPVTTPASAGLALYARSPEYRISVINAAGDTIRRIVREAAHRPVTDAAWQEVQDSLTSFRRSQPPGASCEPATIERPAGMPVIAGLYYDHGGRLIVEVFTDNGFAFDFHDEEDRLIASAPVPERDRRVPPYFRDDHICVATQGQLDTPGVAVYRITRE